MFYLETASYLITLYIFSVKELLLFLHWAFLVYHGQVALKFEHRNSKGCSFGPPYEWQVYT